MEYDRSIVELVFYSSYDEPLMKQFYNPFFKDISYTDKVLTTQSDTDNVILSTLSHLVMYLVIFKYRSSIWRGSSIIMQANHDTQLLDMSVDI